MTGEAAAADGLQLLPEPYTIGDPGRSYHEIGGGAPSLGSIPNDTVCDGFDFEGWSLRAASVRGLTHRYAAQPRQDSYAVRYRADRQRLVVAVCDGVGSAPESHRAAALVAACLADSLVDGEDHDYDWTAAFTVASDAVLDAAVEVGGVARDVDGACTVMATTATLVVIDGVGSTGPWTLRAGSIGDSAVWTGERPSLDAGFGDWKPIVGGRTLAVDGPATTTTSALPVRDGTRVEAVRATLEPGELVLVCTDGIGDAFAKGTGEVATTLGNDWARPPTPLNFAAQVSFGRRSHVDDRTGVVVWTPPR